MMTDGDKTQNISKSSKTSDYLPGVPPRLPDAAVVASSASTLMWRPTGLKIFSGYKL